MEFTILVLNPPLPNKKKVHSLVRKKKQKCHYVTVVE